MVCNRGRGGCGAWSGIAVVATGQYHFVSYLGFAAVAASQAETERRYWLTDEELVFGNTNAYRILDRGDITGVRFEDDSLRIDRRGWRPALTCDTGDIDDPERLRDALR
ncbi:MAG: hypothetical protein U5K28_10700 [Halobacteriales archaeon]|nr:hypothetical protein [Halobacteriales archaeon]